MAEPDRDAVPTEALPVVRPAVRHARPDPVDLVDAELQDERAAAATARRRSDWAMTLAIIVTGLIAGGVFIAVLFAGRAKVERLSYSAGYFDGVHREYTDQGCRYAAQTRLPRLLDPDLDMDAWREGCIAGVAAQPPDVRPDPTWPDQRQ